MCISCGCGMPNDRHNNPDLITQEDLDKAAKAANMSAKDAAKNIADAEGLNCKMQGAGVFPGLPGILSRRCRPFQGYVWRNTERG
ncbi:MAG: hypothetical protein A4E28_00462 [Methanocella sp. PtaU1.Bin125]|nr:MAG: hypothetical protein A4E28_00462 [Methanocella sp. PtaU1.Bin125]